MNVLYINENIKMSADGRSNLPHETCGLSLATVPAEFPRADRGRVLLVDDNESVRETLADLLELEGFCAVQAESAEEAVTLLHREPSFDVLVTDLSMQGADGITLIHQARQIQPDIPAILLTGYAEQVTSVAVVAGDNFHVLRKPVESDRLVEQITVLMKRA